MSEKNAALSLDIQYRRPQDAGSRRNLMFMYLGGNCRDPKHARPEQMKVYLSSTFNDLRRHRAIVGRALRKARYEVVMMEEYVARDEIVEFACQGDVTTCDVYVGIFAWRIGHIPGNDNTEGLSVTEMEYEAAGSRAITRLTFLLNDHARWPKDRKDPDLVRISDLRARLKKQCSAYFDKADELAVEVLAALRVHESTRFVKQVEAIDLLRKAQELGPSYIASIKSNLGVLREAPFVAIQVGPTPWWSTRLHLVAALAQDFGCTRGVAFLDAENRFLLMASPSEVRRRLARRWPDLEKAYANLLREAPTLEKIGDQLWRYPDFVTEAFGEHEDSAKHIVVARDLEYELGIAREAEVVEVDGKGQWFLQQEILGRQTHFVALVRNRQFEGLVDRDMLVERVAEAAIKHLG